ncbi:MAG: hypothetical protein LN414_03290, partial [Candidatus Thermoplasmatota archaeon]|nr:hypothetical protein [Candidatus Thermoplasmatota archaeon]
MMVLIFIAMLFCIQVRAYPTHLGEVRSNWVDVYRWKQRVERDRVDQALSGINIKRWRHKVTFNENGGMSMRPRWFIRHKRRLIRIAITVASFLITYYLLSTPIPLAMPLAVINSNGGGGGNWSNGPSWVGGIAPGIADDAIVVGGDTINVDLTPMDCLSIQTNAGSNLVFIGANELRTNGINGGGFCVDLDGILTAANGKFTLIDDLANNALMDWVGEGGVPWDVELTYRDRMATQTTAISCDNLFSVTTGTWDSDNAGDWAITVTATCTVSSTLLCNGSTVTLNFDLIIGGNMDFEDGTLDATGGRATTINGTLTMGTSAAHIIFCSDLTGSGTWNLESSTVEARISGSGNVTLINMTIQGGTSLLVLNHTGTLARGHSLGAAAGNLYDVQLSCTGASGEALIQNAPYFIDHDLTIDATCTWDTDVVDMTVTGDVLNNGIVDGGSATISFGSFEAGANSTYTATSGITYVTSETAAGVCWSFHEATATFTHSNGTLVIVTAATTNFIPGDGQTYYNIIADHASLELRMTGSTLGNLVIANDLTVTSGIMERHGSRVNSTWTITGDVDVTGWLGEGADAGANNFGSIVINSGGTYEATLGTTTITNEAASGWNFTLVSGGTFTHNGGIVSMTYAGATTVNAPGITFNDLVTTTTTLAFGGGGNYTFAGDLTVTSGTMRRTGTQTMTVTGDVDVSGYLNLSDSANDSFGSITVNSGGTWSAADLTTTITSETSGGYSINIKSGSTLVHNDGVIDVDYAGTAYIECRATGNPYDLVLSGGSRSMYQNLSIDNDLTISSGSLVVQSSKVLTVTENVVVTGTLDGVTGTLTLGSLKLLSGGLYDATTGTTTITSGDSMNALWTVPGSTLTHNDGVFLFNDSSATQYLRIYGTGNLYNVTVNKPARTLYCDDLTIANDFSITSGTVTAYEGWTDTLTVTGDLVISSNGTLGDSLGRMTGAYSFGSITLNSGAAFHATTSTTTITSANGASKSIDVLSGATFNHKNGQVLVQNSPSFSIISMAGTGNLYDLEIDYSGANMVRWSVAGTIDNDLTVTQGKFDTDSGSYARDLTVTGDVDIAGTGTIDAENFATSVMTFGSLTVQSGGEYQGTGGTTYITSETAGGYALNFVSGSTYTSGGGTIQVDTNADTNIFSSGSLNIVVISVGSNTCTIADGGLTIDAALTIDASATLDTGADRALAVAGAISITGTMTCNSSAVDLAATTIESGGTMTAPDGSGALTISNWFDNYGTFTHSDGTVTFDGATGPAIN